MWFATAIGHVFELETAALLQQHGGDVRPASRPGGGVGQGVRPRPGGCDHLLETLEGLLRMRDQRIGAGADHRAEGEGLHHPIGQLHQRFVGCERVIGQQPRIAIGRRARDFRGADRARGAAAIVDHHGAAQQFAQAGLEDARHGVVGATRREVHDNADGAIGPGTLCPGDPWHREPGQAGAEQ